MEKDVDLPSLDYLMSLNLMPFFTRNVMDIKFVNMLQNFTFHLVTKFSTFKAIKKFQKKFYQLKTERYKNFVLNMLEN